MSLSLYPKSIEHNFAFRYATVHPSLYRNLGQPYGTYISTLYHYIHKEESFVLLCTITSRIFLLIPIFYQIRKAKGTSESQRNAGKKEEAFFLVATSGDIILFYLFIYDRITLGFLLFVYIMLFLLENLGLFICFLL